MTYVPDLDLVLEAITKQAPPGILVRGLSFDPDDAHDLTLLTMIAHHRVVREELASLRDFLNNALMASSPLGVSVGAAQEAA
jgi:hypothetical protein